MLDPVVSTQPPAQKVNFDSCARKLQKFSCKKSDRKTYFT